EANKLSNKTPIKPIDESLVKELKQIVSKYLR
ncbi:unnamed protein product, partial [marine sediment metagenome]